MAQRILSWLCPLVLLGAVPAFGQQPKCDPVLMDHVYHPERLQVLKSCIMVTGTIKGVVKEPDGDDHIRLKVDPPYQDLLNARNMTGQHGALVVEPICEHPVTQADAKSSCAHWPHKFIPIPKVGTHVRVVGVLVEDDQHAKMIDGKRVAWREVHPATSLEVIPSTPE
jgi:hypothetical protein